MIDTAIVVLLVTFGWLALGIVTSLLIGPLLGRHGDDLSVPYEAEPVPELEPLLVPAPAGGRRSWRMGLASFATVVAASTGMAAAGALPGTAQAVAHRVFHTVGLEIPKPATQQLETAAPPAPATTDPPSVTPEPAKTTGGEDRPAPATQPESPRPGGTLTSTPDEPVAEDDATTDDTPPPAEDETLPPEDETEPDEPPDDTTTGPPTTVPPTTVPPTTVPPTTVPPTTVPPTTVPPATIPPGTSSTTTVSATTSTTTTSTGTTAP